MDEFGYKSYGDYFQCRDKGEYYTKHHYDTAGYVNSMFSKDPNTVSRLRNLMVTAIAEYKLLPKFIVIVPDDNIIRCLNHSGDGISRNLTRLVKSIMEQHKKYLDIYKELLAVKSKRMDFPRIIWIKAPIHENFHNNVERGKFNSCLNEVACNYDNVSVLKLKKVWDPMDKTLYFHESCRYTAEGYIKYWEAVDKTVKFCDTILLKKIAKRNSKEMVQGFKPKNMNLDRNQWRKPNKGSDMPTNNANNDTYCTRRTLPTPPQASKNNHNGDDEDVPKPRRKFHTSCRHQLQTQLDNI